MLLLHLALGIAIAIPFFVFAITHAKKMIRMWNKRARECVRNSRHLIANVLDQRADESAIVNAV